MRRSLEERDEAKVAPTASEPRLVSSDQAPIGATMQQVMTPRSAMAPWTLPGSGPTAARGLLTLQRRLGNQRVLAVLRHTTGKGMATAPEAENSAVQDDYVADPGELAADEGLDLVHPIAPVVVGATPLAPRRGEGFVNAGRLGTARAGDPVVQAYRLCPHAFVNGGRTGTVPWGGGGGAGARGNEGAGTIQTQVVPVYTTSAGPAPGKFSSHITPGTGKLTVTRSWVGINAGDQGTGWYVTAGAAGRFNSHEVLHVTSSSGFYTTHLTPLEARVANALLGQNAGATAAAAVAAHKATIAWAPSITAFQTADTAANSPMGTVDTADLASGTYPVDAGPATVAGKAYVHVVRLPGEANPAP